MIKLTPPAVNFKTVESAVLSIDNFELPLIPENLRLHHLIVPSQLFDNATNIKLDVVFLNGSKQTFTKPNKSDWIYFRMARIGKKKV
jgi:hypothetical protein